MAKQLLNSGNINQQSPKTTLSRPKQDSNIKAHIASTFLSIDNGRQSR